jgi:hypothetical protein
MSTVPGEPAMPIPMTLIILLGMGFLVLLLLGVAVLLILGTRK